MFGRSVFLPRCVRSYFKLRHCAVPYKALTTEANISVVSPLLTIGGKNDQNLDLKFKQAAINHVWLRDHCKCDQCMNHKTNQRSLDISDISVDIQPKEAKFDANGRTLNVVWPDGHHSIYDSHELIKMLTTDQEVGQPKTGWPDQFFDDPDNLPTVPYQNFMRENGLKDHISNVVKYGISMITEVPYESTDTTRDLCERVALIDETIFGKFWIYTGKHNDEMPDLGYENIDLAAHQDATFYEYMPGIKAFHCIEHSNGAGGESLFLDGFACAQLLKEQDPLAFEFLTQVPIGYEFVSKTRHFYTRKPVIQLGHSGNVEQLRYSVPDRAPLNGLSNGEIGEFYRSFKLLHQIINDPQRELWMKLKPGTVVFADNWRVLHGRSSFSGKRVVAGCFLSRDDFLSKARLLNIL